MHSAQRSDKRYGALPLPDQASEPVVAFYLTQETDLPAAFSGEYQKVTIEIPGSSGRPVEKPALRVTFSNKKSVEEPVGLLGFGSDLRCHVLLPADVVSPVHCRVYAQLNSGPEVWVVQDSSAQGTRIQDYNNSSNDLSTIVHNGRQAVQGLRSVAIGPYKFQIRSPTNNIEIRRREDWFRLNKPIPVTLSMLIRQLDGLQSDWARMECVGEGGNAMVHRYMEKSTALFVAVKEEKIRNSEHQALVLKEIKFMRTLRHPFLVDLLFDDCDNKPLPTIFTAMPLYLGHLLSILPLPDIPTIERVMLQIAEGLRFMHSNLVLHRDLKPENILVGTPESIKIADYGWAASLKDTDSLYGVCGTVAYCAPEALKTNEIHTPAIDVYSLGAVYYAILELDKVERGWILRLLRGRKELFNTTFENACQSPPYLFPGLVQSMLDPNRKGRCSLDETIEILKAQKYDWTRQAPVIPRAGATHLAAGCLDIQKTTNTIRLQQIPFGKARPKANMPKPTLFAQDKWPKMRQTPQQAPTKHDHKNWPPVWEKREPAAPVPQVLPMQRPRSKPTHAQGVNFNAGLPSYEEATSQNPFAPLARKGAKDKKCSHLGQQSKEPRIKPAVRPPSKERNLRLEALRAVITEPRMSHHPALRSRINLHRAHDAGVHRRHEQPDRQAARKRRLAKLQSGVCDVAKGYWNISTALLGFACDGLFVGGERIYTLFTDNNPAAREALRHAAQIPNVNADARLLVASVQGQNRRTKGSRRQRSAGVYTDAEMLDRQLVVSRRR